PLMSATTVTEEYWRAHQYLGFTWDELVDISVMSFDSAFLHHEEKQDLLVQVSDEIRELEEGAVEED
ncbi:MAG: adenosine deaminase, partial [Gemmatimonadetes bacterium]|nr:adenosine deaminase [Gemmatimonadota bacterium]